MENLRKRIKIRVVRNSQDFIKYTPKPTCVNWKVFENSLVGIHEKKISLILNKPIYVRFIVLETSKWELYNFHCNFMIRKFNIRLLLTDTDNLCYELHEKSSYKKLCKYKELFDLSNFPVSSEYYCCDNRKVVGKMKDEGHNALIEFQEFHDTLFQKKIVRHTMRGIKSKNHNLGSYETNKTSLSCLDDKRYIFKNGIITLAYGHKDI